MTVHENVATVPTIGFNYEEFKFKKFRFGVWDIGG